MGSVKALYVLTSPKSQTMASLEAIFDPTDSSAPGHYGPSQTALLLLDFHGTFVEMMGGNAAPAALEVAVKMRNWAKLQSIQVIHCLIDVGLVPYATCKNAGRFAGISEAMKADGGDKEPTGLVENGGDMTFMRQPGFVSALKSPGLEEFLQKKGIRSLVLAGLSTSGCVLRTGLAATDAEYVVTTISNGCADSKGNLHEVVLTELLNNRGFVTSASEFQEGFVGAQGK